MYYPNQISNRSVAGLASAKFSRTGPTGGSRGKEGKGGLTAGRRRWRGGSTHAHTHAVQFRPRVREMTAGKQSWKAGTVE